jgi:TolB-like protein
MTIMCRTTFLRVGCTILSFLLPPAAATVALAAAEPAASQPTTVQHEEGATGVLVAPLDVIGGNESVHELAHAIQKSIVQDISRSRQFRVTEGGSVPANRDAAIASGKAAAADYVVSGTIQESDGRVRVSGDVLDVGNGQTAGSFKTTGDTRDVFDLEDQVAARVRLHLMRSVALARGAPGEHAAESQPAEVPPSEPLRARVRSIDPDWLTPPDYSDNENDNDLAYRYNYSSPYDYWSSPYWAIPYGYGNYYGVDDYPYFGYGLGYGYGGYNYSFYRPWRPLYQHRSFDFFRRGLPDRRPFYGFGPRVLRSFSGPVPLHGFSGHAHVHDGMHR